MSAASCRTCAAPVPEGARFCSQCGTPVAGARVPANIVQVERRYFGLAPATLVLGIALLVLAGGIVLAARGRLLSGALLALAGLLLLVAFLPVARTHPDSSVARATVRAVDAAGTRLGLIAGMVSASARARRERSRVLTEMAVLEGRRRDLLLALGAAAHAGDAAEAESLRRELDALDDGRRAREEELEQIAAAADDRIRQAQLEAQPTESVEPADER